MLVVVQKLNCEHQSNQDAWKYVGKVSAVSCWVVIGRVESIAVDVDRNGSDVVYDWKCY